MCGLRSSSSLPSHPLPPATTPPPATAAFFSPLNPHAVPPPLQCRHQFLSRMAMFSRSPPTSPVVLHPPVAASPTYSPTASSHHLLVAASPPPPPAIVTSFSPLNPRAAPPPQCRHQLLSHAAGRSPPTSPTSIASPRHRLPNAFAHRPLSLSALRCLPSSISRNRRLLLSPEPSCRASSSSSSLAPPPILSPIAPPTSGTTLGNSG